MDNGCAANRKSGLPPLTVASDTLFNVGWFCLTETNVSPALLSAQNELAKARVEEKLNKKLSARPAKETLVSNNIMKGW